MEAVARAQEIRKRLGDEQSSLLDEFERMSFAAELNRAMLGRSLSEPGFPRSAATAAAYSSNSRSRVNVIPNIPPLLTHQVKQGRRRPAASAFHKLLKKLLKPVLGRKTKQNQQQRASDLKHHHHPLSCNTFSRSLRF